MTVQDALSRWFVVVNPRAGGCAPGVIRSTLERRRPPDVGATHVHELGNEDDLKGAVSRAIADGYDTIVAAGGDGTVSSVAGLLVGTKARLGIIPVGTTNVLARELAIPIDVEAACGLLDGPNQTVPIDAMKIGGAHYFVQVGVGLDALMIRDTTVASKKKFGYLAYLATATRGLLGFPSRRFTIEVDGRGVRKHGIQVLLANCGALGISGLRWGPDIRPDDGRIDLCLVRARSLADYASIAWNVALGRHRDERRIHYFPIERSASIRARKPMPIQADGEMIGETPLLVEVVPGAIRAVVPDSPT